jgi:uncharacterized protein YjbI with pentapeptide repeats
LGDTILEGSCFQQALFWGSDLSNVQAYNTFWQEADLSSSRLQNADFKNAFMHKCCLRGVIAGRSKWHGARLIEADFRTGLDQLTDLGEAEFRDADLSFALLEEVNLYGADFRGSCLYGTNLAKADLRHADFRGCDLREAQMDGANITGTKFLECLLPSNIQLKGTDNE